MEKESRPLARRARRLPDRPAKAHATRIVRKLATEDELDALTGALQEIKHERATLVARLDELAQFRNVLALHHLDSGSIETAKILFEENLRVVRQLSDDHMVGITLGFLGWIAIEEGDFDTACQLEEESLVIGRDLDSYSVTGNALELLGGATYLKGDLESAKVLYEEAADLEWRTKGHENPSALPGLGFVAYAQGDLTSARQYFGRALKMLREVKGPDPWAVFETRRTLWGLALVLAQDEQTRHAGTLLAAVEATAGPPSPPGRPPWIAHEHALYLQLRAEIEATLTPDDLRQAQQRGAAMPLKEAIDYALGLLEEAAQA